jgi:hypothetical protein
VAGVQPAAGTRAAAWRIYFVGSVFVLALISAWAFPMLDRALNPGLQTPGLVSFVGVGLSVLVVTALLLFAGLRGVLPRTAVFLGAAFGYNALLILVKFGLGPLALYAASEGQGFVILNTGSNGLGVLAFPGLAAITAILYGTAFFLLYAFFHSRLRTRLGIPIRLERRFLTLFITMFVIAVVGGVTVIGLFGFLEYLTSLFYVAVLGLLLALALLGALVLCTVAFHEATEQAVLMRNVTVLSSFAWVGLAFIAAYHIVWLVFVLTLVSLWPLKSMSLK